MGRRRRRPTGRDLRSHRQALLRALALEGRPTEGAIALVPSASSRTEPGRRSAVDPPPRGPEPGRMSAPSCCLVHCHSERVGQTVFWITTHHADCPAWSTR